VRTDDDAAAWWPSLPMPLVFTLTSGEPSHLMLVSLNDAFWSVETAKRGCNRISGPSFKPRPERGSRAARGTVVVVLPLSGFEPKGVAAVDFRFDNKMASARRCSSSWSAAAETEVLQPIRIPLFFSRQRFLNSLHVIGILTMVQHPKDRGPASLITGTVRAQRSNDGKTKT
jgi:hypothetical protein